MIKDARFKELSSDAKLLYGLMLDRMSLSVKNGWFDDENRAYIYYTTENIMDDLGCARATCAKVIAELDSKKGIGLIEKRRQGLGKPNIIYVKNFVGVEQTSEPEMKEEKPDDSDVSTEAQKLNFKKFRNQTSGSLEIEPVEVQKVNPNYNHQKYTDMSYNNPINQSESEGHQNQIDVMDDVNAYIKLIKENIEYDHHMQYDDWQNKELYDELFEVICDIVCEA